MLMAMQKETAILETYRAAKPAYEERLKDHGIRSFRIAMCHAMLMALFDALTKHLLPELAEYQPQIQQVLFHMATDRDQLMEQESHIITAFWDLVERIESKDTSLDSVTLLNHSKRPDQLFAINMTQFYQHCRARHYDVPPQNELLDALRISKRYKFVSANTPTWSALESRSIRCWVFEKPRSGESP